MTFRRPPPITFKDYCATVPHPRKAPHALLILLNNTPIGTAARKHAIFKNARPFYLFTPYPNQESPFDALVGSFTTDSPFKLLTELHDMHRIHKL